MVNWQQSQRSPVFQAGANFFASRAGHAAQQGRKLRNERGHCEGNFKNSVVSHRNPVWGAWRVKMVGTLHRRGRAVQGPHRGIAKNARGGQKRPVLAVQIPSAHAEGSERRALHSPASLHKRSEFGGEQIVGKCCSGYAVGHVGQGLLRSVQCQRRRVPVVQVRANFRMVLVTQPCQGLVGCFIRQHAVGAEQGGAYAHGAERGQGPQAGGVARGKATTGVASAKEAFFFNVQTDGQIERLFDAHA